MDFLRPATLSQSFSDKIASSMDARQLPGYPNYRENKGHYSNVINSDAQTQSALNSIEASDTLLQPIKRLSPSRLTYCLANYLFQPSQRIQTQLKHYLDKLTCPSGECQFIALQIRKGGKQKRFHDNEIRISEHGDKLFIQCARFLATKLKEQSQGRDLKIKFFLSTDDEDLANELANDPNMRDQLFIVPGSVAHLDQSKNISYLEMEKVMLDHLLISYANHAIISPGRYGEFAVGRSFGGVKTLIRSRDLAHKNGEFNSAACMPVKEHPEPFVDDARWGNK